jgi:hypothetical protein
MYYNENMFSNAENVFSNAENVFSNAIDSYHLDQMNGV